MKKQILLVGLLFVFSALSSPAIGQQGNALLKIVKSEDGSVKVYDMQGNEIHQSNADAKAKEEANQTMETGPSQSQEIHQVVLDPADPEAQKELERLEQQQTGNIITGEGAVAVEMPESDYPETIESVGLSPSDWENAKDENDLQAIEKVKNSMTTDQAMNPGPDLGWTPGSWNSMSYTAPDLSITIRVENNGTSSAGASYVGYYLSTNTSITTGDYLIGYDYVSSLAAGSYSTESITVNLCAVTPAIPAGTYYAGIYVDYRLQVTEDSESNNGAYYTPSISWSQSCANLTCYTGALYNYYSFNSSTCLLSYNIRIKNNGNATAASSYVAYYLSTNSTITTGDIRIGTDYVSALAPGAYSNESISNVNVGSYVAPGTYYVGFICDYNNQVSESSETDNNWYTSPSFATTCPCANLTATGQPASYNYNSSTHALTINVRVKNDGICSTGSSSTLGYYLSTNTIISTGDCKLGTDYVSTLAAGAYSNESITISDICTKACVTNGTWYVGFLIDETNAVAESNEGDNSWYFTPTIVVNCGGCANLTAEGQPASYNYNSGNCQLDINVRVINNGTCAASSTSTLGYYLSNDTDITTGDCKLGSDTLPDLAAGVHSDQAFSLSDICSKSCVATGTWYVGFIIDDANDVSESNEGDNAWRFTPAIDVTCPCGGGGCSIKVTSPDGGEVWDENTAHQITWNLTGTCSEVKIEYSLTGGAPWTVIKNSTPNDGTYNWTLPEVGATETNCKVKISCTDATCSDMSNSPFTIKNIGAGCPLKVIVPNSRVAWKAGMNYKISWIPAGKSGNVKIEYSTNNGGSWSTIESSTPDVGCYCMTIPTGTSSHQALIRISDVGDPSCHDVSDVAFTIGDPVAPYLLVTDIMGAPGGADVTAEIRIGGNTNPIDAISMDLYYNTNHLEFVEAQNVDLTTGWIFDANETTPGEIKIGGLIPTGTPIAVGSSGIIAKVKFKITCPSCTDCDQSHLIPANYIEDLATMNAYSGTYSYAGCCECGDVNMNGVISSEDALCAFRIYLAGGVLPPGHPECHTECSMVAADVNANGMVTSEDALGIFKYYLQGFWDPGFCGNGLYKKQKQSYNLILDNVFGQQGDIVKVPIQVDNPKGLSAFGLDLEYPANLLEYIGTEKTNLTQDWIALDGNETKAGMITLGGFHTDAINVTSTAAIANVSFRVKKGANGEDKLNVFYPTDDLSESFFTEGSFSTDISQLAPTSYKLSQNYPNPFNMDTNIEYQLPEAAQVRVNIYNIAGQKLRTLINANMDVGIHNVRWDGKDDVGRTMASGIYICKLETGNKILSIKMLLMK